MPDTPVPPSNGSPSDPGADSDDLTLGIRNVSARPIEGSSTVELTIETTRGIVRGLLDPAEGETGAVVYCDGAMGGPHEVLGPGDRSYEALAHRLAPQGVTSLRIHYRHAGELEEAVLDVLAACSFLQGIGARSVALVGHSFGGAVVIKAGELAPIVVAVASLSPQLSGTRQVEQLGKPLLLIHGDADQVLSHEASEDIYARALDPKRLVLLEGSGHALRQGAQELIDELEPYLLGAVGPRAVPGS